MTNSLFALNFFKQLVVCQDSDIPLTLALRMRMKLSLAEVILNELAFISHHCILSR